MGIAAMGVLLHSDTPATTHSDTAPTTHAYYSHAREGGGGGERGREEGRETWRGAGVRRRRDAAWPGIQPFKSINICTPSSLILPVCVHATLLHTYIYGVYIHLQLSHQRARGTHAFGYLGIHTHAITRACVYTNVYVYLHTHVHICVCVRLHTRDYYKQVYVL